MEEPSGESLSAEALRVRCLECGTESPLLAAGLCARCGAPLSDQQPAAAPPAAGESGHSIPPLPADTVGGPPGQWTRSGYSRRPALVLAGTGVVLLAALGAAIGVAASSTRSTNQPAPAPPATRLTPAPATTQLGVYSLEPGDCLAGSNMGLGNSNPWPTDVTQVACTKPHEAEVYFVADIWPQSMAYPKDSTIDSQAEARCDTAFTAYDGADYSQSAFSYTEIVPDSANWASGDRSMVCVAFEPDSSGPSGATPVNYSIKGSND
jgi:Septum formation